MSPSTASSRLFLAIDGQPVGPHGADEVRAMRRSGRISDDTLICPEGGSGWVRLREFDPSLCVVLPPIPPAGYAPAGGPAPVAASRPAFDPPPPVESKPNAAKPLHLATLIAAIVCFFVPWLEVRCNGVPCVQQSGFQTITNRASVDDMMNQTVEAGRKDKPGRPKLPASTEGDLEKNAGISVLAAAALVAVMAALVVAAGGGGAKLSGILAAAALTCLIVQSLIGFPFEAAIKREFVRQMTPNPSADDAMAVQMMAGMDLFTVKYTTGYYLEMAALTAAMVLGWLRAGRQGN